MGKFFWISLLFAFFLLASYGAKGQGVVYLKLFEKTGTIEKEFGQEYSRAFGDSLSVVQYLHKVRKTMISRGYVTATVDSVKWQADTVSVFFDTGEKFEWAYLQNGNVPEEYLSRIGYREKLYRNQAFSPESVARILKGVLAEAENNGYPFAEIRLDSVQVFDQKIKAQLKYSQNQYVKIDSLIIKGNIETSRNYLQNYLGIKSGMQYDQSLLNHIPNRLRELPFVQSIKPYEIGYREGHADVYLYLDNRKASNFNGILGVLPDHITNKTVVTGDVELNLMNALKNGETINLRWQRLQTRTTQLDLRFAYPYMFKTKFGTDLSLNLFRQDTLFSQVIMEAAAQYFYKGINYVGVFVQRQEANLISHEFFSADRFVDSRITMVGVKTEIQSLDYRFNPRSGYFIQANASAGGKIITQNAEVDPVFYENINLETDIYNLNVLMGKYTALGTRSTVLLRMHAGHFINENMFRNEMYRLGGLKSIRGFDEQTIFANSFAVATIEYRYILEQNSNLFVFLDQAYYENSAGQNVITDTPLGFGGGINFETGAGVFSLTYALGRQFDNNFNIRSGKIHFGFISFF